MRHNNILVRCIVRVFSRFRLHYTQQWVRNTISISTYRHVCIAIPFKRRFNPPLLPALCPAGPAMLGTGTLSHCALTTSVVGPDRQLRGSPGRPVRRHAAAVVQVKATTVDRLARVGRAYTASWGDKVGEDDVAAVMRSNA